MSLSLVLASGFLFLGGIALAFLFPSDAMTLTGVILAVAGAVPLLACQLRSFLRWYSRQPFSFLDDSKKEEPYEDTKPE